MYKQFIITIIITLLLGVKLTQSTEMDECFRECVREESPKICNYTWILEHYHAMGP